MIGRPPLPRNRKYILERSEKQTSGCWHWTGCLRPDGYGKTSAYGKQCLAHRLSYCIWSGMSMTDEKLVLHKCNNKKCVNPKHLYAGTQYENVQDYIRIGVRPFRHNYNGANNPNLVLDIKACTEIKNLLNNGVSVRELCNKFGCSYKPIYAIKNGTHWSQK